MTVMTASGFILIGAVQIVASVAYALVTFVAFMVIIETMDPPGSKGGLAAADTKVAFIAG